MKKGKALTKPEDLDKQILSFGVNEIHKACQNVGHTTNWEYFDDELKTYAKEDKLRLLKELKNNEEGLE